MTAAADSLSAGALAAQGLFATTDAVAAVTELHGAPGSGQPERVLRARLMRGFDIDVLPSRGFDIGDASFRGIPISWFSPVRDARALPSPSGNQWLSRFTAGLLTTCGLSNIGPATTTDGLHGDVNHRPARDISWSTAIETDKSAIELRATVDCAQLFGDSFSLERCITSSLGADDVAELRIVDRITNIGIAAASVHALYHLNFGAPLVTPGTEVHASAEQWIRRDPTTDPFNPGTLPPVSQSLDESVFEYHGIRTDSAGCASARIVSRQAGLAATVTWSATTLPRLYQWVLPTRGRWALGIEPANAPLFGPERSGANAGAPVLPAGASVLHEVTIRVTDKYHSGEEG
jgi:hypothetical protein